MPIFKIQQYVRCVDKYTVEAETREEAVLAVLNGEVESEELSEFISVDDSVGATCRDLKINKVDDILNHLADDRVCSIRSIFEIKR